MERWRGRSNERPRRKNRSHRNNSNGIGLCLLALTISSCCYSRALGLTECSRAAPYFLTADQRSALCREVHTSAPADCARKAHAAPGLPSSLIVELCSAAVSDLPGVCVASLSRSIAKYLSPELRIRVCTGAQSDVSQNADMPTLCRVWCRFVSSSCTTEYSHQKHERSRSQLDLTVDTIQHCILL